MKLTAGMLDELRWIVTETRPTKHIGDFSRPQHMVEAKNPNVAHRLVDLGLVDRLRQSERIQGEPRRNYWLYWPTAEGLQAVADRPCKEPNDAK